MKKYFGGWKQPICCEYVKVMQALNIPVDPLVLTKQLFGRYTLRLLMYLQNITSLRDREL